MTVVERVAEPFERLIGEKVLHDEDALIAGLIVEDARFGPATEECRLLNERLRKRLDRGKHMAPPKQQH